MHANLCYFNYLYLTRVFGNKTEYGQVTHKIIINNIAAGLWKMPGNAPYRVYVYRS
jgi:hypothetical protein